MIKFGEHGRAIPEIINSSVYDITLAKGQVIGIIEHVHSGNLTKCQPVDPDAVVALVEAVQHNRPPPRPPSKIDKQFIHDNMNVNVPPRPRLSPTICPSHGHVKNFAIISAPLTCLTCKDSPWKKGPLPPKAMKAFKDMQSILCSEPVMAYPDPML